MNKFTYYWLPLLAYLGIIFYFSSIPEICLIESIPQFILKDKLLHILEYLILSILFYRTLNQYQNLKHYSFILAVTFSALYGLTDEFHQLFVPGRIFSVLDLFADLVGSSLIYFRKVMKFRS